MTHADHLSQSGSKKRKRKESSDNHSDYPEVALDQLQVNSLKRYKRLYKLQMRQGLTKVQLVENVGRHFRSIPVNQKEVVAYFIYMVKMDKNKIDNKEASSHHSDDEKKDLLVEK